MSEKPNKVIFSVAGRNGVIIVYCNRIDIFRQGVIHFVNNGVKTIFISKITSIQFKEASKKNSGFIQFVYPGAIFNSEIEKDDNSMVFEEESNEDFKKLREYLNEHIQ